MALTTALAGTVASRLPKVASPQTHSMLDYAMASVFFVAGGWFWKRNRRASVAAFANGGVIAAVALATNYPGGVRKKISYRMHGGIESVLPAVTASLPSIGGFSEKKEAQFFSIMAIATVAVAALTKFEQNKGFAS